MSPSTNTKKPIVYTIAGSDSGGGAGIQADLHAMHSFGCHGCSAITCLTAQNSMGVTSVHTPPTSFLEEQLHTLYDDLPPNAIKIGMIGTTDIALTISKFIKEKILSSESAGKKRPFIVLDPVMISTSGSKLIDDNAKNVMIKEIFPYADIITPNKYEAEELLGYKLNTVEDVENGASKLIDEFNVSAVLIKGGHSNDTSALAQDYLLVKSPDKEEQQEKPRLCDGHRGVWIRTKRYKTDHTHGTGCTLSSAIASALALGSEKNDIDLVDACCLGKAYISAGISNSIGLGSGPGPVVHTKFPSSHEHYPTVVPDPTSNDIEQPSFQQMKPHSGSSATSSNNDNNESENDVPVLGRILPIVDSVDWVKRLAEINKNAMANDKNNNNNDLITDIQLRIKDTTDENIILSRVKECQSICNEANIRLWINDYCNVALEAGDVFGVHIGQEDLLKNSDVINKLKAKGMALGISTHSYSELCVALSISPTYVSLGPIYATKSKKVRFGPQGLSMVRKWNELINTKQIPLVVIGGIDTDEKVKDVRENGANCIAVIGAITATTNANEICKKITNLNNIMS